MRLIKPDFHGRVEIEGIAGLVPRPVSIDQAVTGFERLRTLRVYQFSKDVPVDGHAEEDEVLIVAISGSLELKLTGMGVDVGPVRLEGVRGSSISCCAAYLSPGGEYRLVPTSSAEVAYVRARPLTGQPPMVFERAAKGDGIFDESTYAEILRTRIVKIPAILGEGRLESIAQYRVDCERLIHFQDVENGASVKVRAESGEQLSIHAWDTLALGTGERPEFTFSEGASSLVCLFAA